MPGFPIRTPWDHSLVDSSPRPIVASHVLHRLLVPRHPPFALDNLTTKNKMLASTVQFSTNDQPTTPTAPHQTSRNSAYRPAHSNGMGDQVMPGTEGNNPQLTLLSVVLSGPNRVLIISYQPHRPSRSVPTRRPAVLGSVGRCRRKLASVSACEHPTTTYGQCGLLNQFLGLVAP